jgi:CBS domain-containing protein
MLAKDLMTETEFVAPLDMAITDLATKLREKRIGGVPVINSQNKFCGIVTVTDLFNVMSIVRKVGGKMNWFSNFMFSKKTMTVKDIYTRKLISVLPETPIEVVVGLMLDKNIHTIPVMDKEQSALYGVIGRHDVTCAALGLLTPKGVVPPAGSAS